MYLHAISSGQSYPKRALECDISNNLHTYVGPKKQPATYMIT